jgi:hypothetical protein
MSAEPLADPHLCDGNLKWLLPQKAVEPDGLFLYYPRRFLGAKVSRPLLTWQRKR